MLSNKTPLVKDTGLTFGSLLNHREKISLHTHVQFVMNVQSKLTA
jgi:hypothetical protein